MPIQFVEVEIPPSVPIEICENAHVAFRAKMKQYANSAPQHNVQPVLEKNTWTEGQCQYGN